MDSKLEKMTSNTCFGILECICGFFFMDGYKYLICIFWIFDAL